MMVAKVEYDGVQLGPIAQRILIQMSDREDWTVPALDTELVINKDHSREAVRYRLDKLCEAGLIMRMNRYERNKGSRKDSPRYRILDAGIDLIRERGSELSAPSDIDKVIEQVQSNSEDINSLETTVRDRYSTHISQIKSRLDELEDDLGDFDEKTLRDASLNASKARQDVRDLRDEVNSAVSSAEDKAVRARSSASEAHSDIATMDDDLAAIESRLTTLTDDFEQMQDEDDSTSWWPF